jgi:hypothetical protein
VVDLEDLSDIIPEWAAGEVSLVCGNRCGNVAPKSGYIEVSDPWFDLRAGVVFDIPDDLGEELEDYAWVMITSPLVEENESQPRNQQLKSVRQFRTGWMILLSVSLQASSMEMRSK